MGKPTTFDTSLVPTLDDLVESGEAVPNYQPGVFSLLPAGWRPLRIDPEGLYWPGDSKPEGYGEVGLETARFLSSGGSPVVDEILAEYWRLDSDDCPRMTEHERIEAHHRLTEVLGEAEAYRLVEALGEAPACRGRIAFDDAVELARHWLKDWPGSVDFEDLRDWLVASFFTLAIAGDGEDSPRFADGSAYIPVTPDMLPPGLALNEDFVRQCTEKAASSRIHHDALRTVAEILLRARLLTGAYDVLEAASKAVASKRGRRPYTNTLRDRAIVATIERLEAEGMTATRNDVSRPRSACDAVAEAFNLSYNRILEIWKNSRRP